MNTKRKSHACFADHSTNSIYIVGGYDGHWNRLSSTEKWTLGQSSWQPSANLSETITSSSAVSSNTDEFIGYMAGGYSNTRETGHRYVSDIYGLRRRDEAWIKLNKTMKTGRHSHSLLNIPANQVLGC